MSEAPIIKIDSQKLAFTLTIAHSIYLITHSLLDLINKPKEANVLNVLIDFFNSLQKSTFAQTSFFHKLLLGIVEIGGILILALISVYLFYWVAIWFIVKTYNYLVERGIKK